MAEKLESEMLFLSLLHLLCSQTGEGGGEAHTYVVCVSVRPCDPRMHTVLFRPS